MMTTMSTTALYSTDTPAQSVIPVAASNTECRAKPTTTTTTTTTDPHRAGNDNRRHDNDESIPMEGGGDDVLLSCHCTSVQTILRLIQSLDSVATAGGSRGYHPPNDKAKTATATTRQRKALQPVTVFCSPTGLTFHVTSPSKQLQASVEVPASVFTEYHVGSGMGPDHLHRRLHKNHNDHHDEPDEEDRNETTQWHANGSFCINLTTLLDCLQLLGASTKNDKSHTTTTTTTQLALSYNETREFCQVELLHDDILCTTIIPGLQPVDVGTDGYDYGDTAATDHDNAMGDSLAFAFRSARVVARIIVQSTLLQSIGQELASVTGATVATVSLDSKQLQIVTVGHWGEGCTRIPSQGSHVISLEIQTAVAFSYPLHAILTSWQALEAAQETCLTINEHGMMAMQHQVIRTGDETPSFVDFILCPLQDVDDDDESKDDDDDNNNQNAQSSQTVTYGGTQQSRISRNDRDFSQISHSSALQEEEDGENEDDNPSRSDQQRSHRNMETPSTTSPEGEPAQRSREDVCISNNEGYGRHSKWDNDMLSSSESDDDQDSIDRGLDDSTTIARTSLFGRLPTKRNTAVIRSIMPPPNRRRRRHHETGATADSDNNDEPSQSQQRMADEETLDVTTVIASQRSEQCSSPELVYGK